MFVVTSRIGGTTIQLVCAICLAPLLQGRAVLAFPADCEQSEGHWCHRGCIDGQFQSLFGTKHLVLCEATAALSHLANTVWAQANGYLQPGAQHVAAGR
jgi:hypothetical protein